MKESDALEKEEKKKGGGEEEEVSLLESERTAKDTKVDFSAKNATASETKSEIEKGTKTDETKITKSRVPILSGKKNGRQYKNYLYQSFMSPPKVLHPISLPKSLPKIIFKKKRGHL